jgi:hypothetical protein
LKNSFNLSFLVLFSVVVAACSKPAEKVGIDQLISNQSIGKNTGMLNARSWLNDNIVPEGAVISVEIDSRMKSDCPQGDGYLTAKVNIPVLDANNKVIGQKVYAELQCATYGDGGCFLTSDAKKKPSYKKDECNTSLPAVFQKNTG